MTSNKDDSGIIYLDFDVDIKDTIPLLQKEPCLPFKHSFEKRLLAQHFYQECSLCGYSPDLDQDKPKFKKCHKDYISWRKNKGLQGL